MGCGLAACLCAVSWKSKIFLFPIFLMKKACGNILSAARRWLLISSCKTLFKFRDVQIFFSHPDFQGKRIQNIYSQLQLQDKMWRCPKQPRSRTRFGTTLQAKFRLMHILDMVVWMMKVITMPIMLMMTMLMMTMPMMTMMPRLGRWRGGELNMQLHSAHSRPAVVAGALFYSVVLIYILSYCVLTWDDWVCDEWVQMTNNVSFCLGACVICPCSWFSCK